MTITWLERDCWSTAPRAAAPAAGGSVVAGPAVRMPKRAPVPSGPPSISPLVTPPRARFERQGAELVLVVPISRDEAAHGAMVPVPMPGASVRLRVPPGTTTGHRFRVPRSNAPAPDGFGDLTVVVEVTR